MTDACFPRSPAELVRVVRERHLETNVRYQPDGLLTWCNKAIHDLTTDLGCPIPFLLANDQHTWLEVEGRMEDWVRCDAIEAQRHAELGCVAVASWRNPTGTHGHIALLVPAPPGSTEHVFIAQAGKENFSCRAIERGFGLSIHPDFFKHP